MTCTWSKLCWVFFFNTPWLMLGFTSRTTSCSFFCASLFSMRRRLKSQLQRVLMGQQAFPLVYCFNLILCPIPVSPGGNQRVEFDRLISSLRFVSSVPPACFFFPSFSLSYFFCHCSISAGKSIVCSIAVKQMCRCRVATSAQNCITPDEKWVDVCLAAGASSQDKLAKHAAWIHNQLSAALKVSQPRKN